MPLLLILTLKSHSRIAVFLQKSVVIIIYMLNKVKDSLKQKLSILTLSLHLCKHSGNQFPFDIDLIDLFLGTMSLKGLLQADMLDFEFFEIISECCKSNNRLLCSLLLAIF